MKNITKESIQAFLNGYAFKKQNMEIVINNAGHTEMRLHGNTIAKEKDGQLWITNCGWFSNTTKERLNGLPNVNIYQKKGIWYLNEQQWDGDWIRVA